MFEDLSGTKLTQADDDTVVPLSARRGRDLFAEADRLVDYWHDLRKGETVPRRSDVDPRAIQSLLEYAFIAEKVAPGLARLRIAGTHMMDLMGMEVRGMPLSALFGPSSRDMLSDALVHLFDEPAMLDIEIRSVREIGRPQMTGRLVILPLKSDLNDISRAIGAFVTNGEVGRTPRRFEIVSIKRKAIDGGHAPVNLSEHTPQTAPRPMRPSLLPAEPAFATRAPSTSDAQHNEAQSKTPQARPSERPYLRLVHSND